jgi:hypothetical protein
MISFVRIMYIYISSILYIPSKRQDEVSTEISSMKERIWDLERELEAQKRLAMELRAWISWELEGKLDDGSPLT